MKRYSAAEARAQLSDALDQAEAGVPVLIERKGVRFVLAREAPDRREASAPLVEILDPAVERGEWTWTPGRRGWRFAARPARRRRR